MPFANRNEFIFLYEAKDCNPNGDPLDENRPRTDPETGVCTVTDVRIKRTIRDEILSWEPDPEKRVKQGMEILIRDTFVDDGSLSTGKQRASAFLEEAVKKAPKGQKLDALETAVLRACIDARLFGTTLPAPGKDKDEGDKGGALQVTGPVQLSAFNRSLHRVAPQLVQQTAAFASKEGSQQKSFAERRLLPYAAIAAYGVCNEIAARTSGATEEDLAHMFRALWRGTNNLATSSKLGHASLLLVRVEYKDGSRLGQLPERIALRTSLEHTAIRSTADYAVDAASLIEDLASFKEQIVSIRVRQDPRLRTVRGETSAPLLKLLTDAGLKPSEL